MYGGVNVWLMQSNIIGAMNYDKMSLFVLCMAGLLMV